MVDHDNERFTMWQSQQSRESDLISIGPPACNTTIPEPPPPASVAQLPPTVTPPSRPTQISKGAIAGAIIGGLATIGLCIGAFLLRKRRRARRLQENERQGFEARMAAQKDFMYSENLAYLKPEMPGDKQLPPPPQEMPLERDTGYRLAPYEMHNIETQEMPATPRLRRINTPELASSYME